MAFTSAPSVSMSAATPPPASAQSAPSSYTLHSIPVSFFAARVRLLIYREPALSSAVTVAAPPGGGMKSGEHLCINPLGKVPSLAATAADDDFVLFESQAIASFLLDEFDLLDAYTHETAQLRARVSMLSAFMDNQLSPLNAALYRAMDSGDRVAKVAELIKQLNVLEQLVDAGPYLVSSKLTLADVNLFGLFALYVWAGPTFFGFRPNDVAARPKLTAWYTTMRSEPAVQKVEEEVHAALQAWLEAGRWEKMGISPSTLFNSKV